MREFENPMHTMYTIPKMSYMKTTNIAKQIIKTKNTQSKTKYKHANSNNSNNKKIKNCSNNIKVNNVSNKANSSDSYTIKININNEKFIIIQTEIITIQKNKYNKQNILLKQIIYRHRPTNKHIYTHTHTHAQKYTNKRFFIK